MSSSLTAIGSSFVSWSSVDSLSAAWVSDPALSAALASSRWYKTRMYWFVALLAFVSSIRAATKEGQSNEHVSVKSTGFGSWNSDCWTCRALARHQHRAAWR
ncbi:hypothetical protein OGATHE_000031 [Ogataea polymorpha]|uniref:Uncharacterized protein n=1 Tax=Ogataea polymorpha TaxID=460523 RepID=A0A9P8PUQ7_9ASCO|nr:hypothetical protein OGATHE_000031 [Ogataea polymorpha]